MMLNPLALLVLALAVMLPGTGHAAATGNAVPPPERNPVRVEAPQAAGEPNEAEAKPAGPTNGWSVSAIEEAKTKCAELLAGIDIDYEPLAPIKRGACGAPAPILVKSIGGNPKVAISPPATMTCNLAAALDKWLKNRVQPEARVAFGSPVVRLRNAADYDCRNRYGNPRAPLSEHAKANALDVSEFKLESGERVTVLNNWPRLVAIGQPEAPPPLPDPNPDRVTVEEPVVSPDSARPTRTASLVSFIRLVGNDTEIGQINPFVAATPLPAPVSVFPASLVTTAAFPAANSRASLLTRVRFPQIWSPVDRSGREKQYRFIRRVHAHACRTFGTTLGPNANAAHANHFHFDMKYRRGGFCQ